MIFWGWTFMIVYTIFGSYAKYKSDCSLYIVYVFLNPIYILQTWNQSRFCLDNKIKWAVPYFGWNTKFAGKRLRNFSKKTLQTERFRFDTLLRKPGFKPRSSNLRTCLYAHNSLPKSLCDGNFELLQLFHLMTKQIWNFNP